MSVSSAPSLMGVSEADREGIKRAALDYAEGWYNADAEQNERSLHPHLAKRIVTTDEATGKDRVSQMSALELVQIIRAKHDVDPVEKRVAEAHILDVFQNAATVRLEMAAWIDYLHLGRVNGEWKIINVLWALK
jgi:hypothetical protein